MYFTTIFKKETVFLKSKNEEGVFQEVQVGEKSLDKKINKIGCAKAQRYKSHQTAKASPEALGASGLHKVPKRPARECALVDGRVIVA